MRFTTQLDLPHGEESIAVPHSWIDDKLINAAAYRLLVVVTYLTGNPAEDHWPELRRLYPDKTTDRAIRLLLSGLRSAGYLVQHGDDYELVHPTHRIGAIEQTEV